MLNVFIMLIIDMVLYMLITMYIDRVYPGQYGVPDSLWFPFKRIVKVNIYSYKHSILNN